jgi:hypothetical protein
VLPRSVREQLDKLVNKLFVGGSGNGTQEA